MDPYLKDLVPPLPTTAQPVIVEEPVTVEETEEKVPTIPAFKKLIFEKDEFDKAVGAMGAQLFAKDLATSFQPITGSSYDELIQGKGSFVEFLLNTPIIPNAEGELEPLKPEERYLTDDQIISIFTNARRGESLDVAGESFLRTLPVGIASSAGFKGGVELGKKVPAVPGGPLGKLLWLGTTGLGGSVIAGMTAEELDEYSGFSTAIFGEERPLTPDMRGAEMAGETLAYFAGFAPIQYMLKKNVYDTLGALTIMENYKGIAAVVANSPKAVSKEVLYAILGKEAVDSLPPKILQRALNSKASKTNFEQGLIKGLWNKWKGRTDLGPRHLRLLASLESGMNVTSSRFTGPSKDIFKRTLQRLRKENPRLAFFSKSDDVPSIVSLAKKELERKLGPAITLDMISALGASYAASLSDPNSPLSRFALEIVGATAPGLAFTTGGPAAISSAKNILKFLDDLVTPSGSKRKQAAWDRDAAMRILAGLKASDEYKAFIQTDGEQEADRFLGVLIKNLIDFPIIKKEALQEGKDVDFMTELLKGELGQGRAQPFAKTLGLIIENVKATQQRLATDAAKGKAGLISEAERTLLAFAAMNSGEFSNKDAVVNAGLVFETIVTEALQQKIHKSLNQLNKTTEKLIKGGIDPARTEIARNTKILLERALKDSINRKNALYGNLKNVQIINFFDAKGNRTNKPLFTSLIKTKEEGGVLPNNAEMREEVVSSIGPAIEALFRIGNRFDRSISGRSAKGSNLNAAETKLQNVSTEFNIKQYDKIVDMMEGTPEEVRRKFVQNMAREPEEVINPNAPTIENVLTIIQTRLGRLLPRNRKEKSELLAAKKYAEALRNLENVRTGNEKLQSEAIASGQPIFEGINASELYEIKTSLQDLLRLSPNNTKAVSGVTKGVIKQLIGGLNKDLEKGNPNSTALALANAYNRGEDNAFVKSFVRNFIAQDVRGADLLSAETALDSMFQGGPSKLMKRMNDLNLVTNLLNNKQFNKQLKLTDQIDFNQVGNKDLKSFSADLETTKSAIFREFLKDIVDVKVDLFGDQKLVVNPTKLEKLKRTPGFKDLLAMFKDVAADLSTVERAQTIVDMKQLDPNNLGKSLFSKAVNALLRDVSGDVPETAMSAVEKAISGSAPVKELDRLLNIVSGKGQDGKLFKRRTFTDVDNNKTFTYPQAAQGLKEQLFTWALEGKLDINAKRFTERLKGKMPNSNKSLLDWMKQAKIGETPDGKPIFMLDDAGEKQINEALKQINDVDELIATGQIEKALFSNPTGMSIASTRMLGATLGQKSQEQLNNLLKKVGLGTTGGGIGGGMVAAREGSQQLVEILLKQPQQYVTNAMARILATPEILGQMLRQVKSKEDGIRKAGILSNFLFEGLPKQFFKNRPYFIKLLSDQELQELSLPSTPPSTYESDEFTAPEEVVIEKEPVDTPVDTSQYLPSPLFRPDVQGPAAEPAAAPSVASGPVDRQRYAAMFPNDFASSLIRSQGGIGSLG